MPLLCSKVDQYALLRDGEHPIATDFSLEVAGVGTMNLHCAMLGSCGMLKRMLAAGMQEQQTANVKLTLPAHTEQRIHDVLRFCYNHELSVDFENADVVDLWRLCDYVECSELSQLLCDGLAAHINAPAFVACGNRAMARRDPPSCAFLSMCLDAIPDDLEPWYDVDSSGVLEVLLRAAQRVSAASADALLKLAANEVSLQWCDLRAVAALSPSNFALLLAHVGALPAALPENHICDIVLSYIDRNGLPFAEEVAQALLTAVDARALSPDYIECCLAPRLPPALRGLYVDLAPPEAVSPQLRCPLTMRDLAHDDAVRMPCGHVFALEGIADFLRHAIRTSSSYRHDADFLRMWAFRCPVLCCNHTFFPRFLSGLDSRQRIEVLNEMVPDTWQLDLVQECGGSEVQGPKQHCIRKARKSEQLKAWAAENAAGIEEAAVGEEERPAKWQRKSVPMPGGQMTLRLIDHVSTPCDVAHTYLISDPAKTVYEALVEPWARTVGLGSEWKQRVWLVFDANRVLQSNTISELELKDGDSVEAYVTQQGGKPVIRLYSAEPLQDVVVALRLPGWDHVLTYPRPSSSSKDGTDAIEWRLAAVAPSAVRWHNGAIYQRSSLLTHSDADGRTRLYDFLFWEADARVGYGSDFALTPKHAVCVCTEVLNAGWLHDTLLGEGLNVTEATEMATHWLPYMCACPYVLVSFLPSAILDRNAPLTITPAPALLIRVFMLFQPVAAPPVGITLVSAPPTPTQAALALPRPSERPPYTVVEWGGMLSHVPVASAG